MINDFFGLHQTHFPYHRKQEVIPAKIKTVMNQFSKWHYDHTLLFHYYCDLIGVTEKSFTLWSDMKFSKGVPAVSGIAVDETLLEQYVWTIRKVPADQLISLLFFSNGKNLSAYELGFIVPTILESSPENTYVFNPSPYIIQDTTGKCRGYIVWDEYSCRAYANQFTTDIFHSYSALSKVESGSRIVALLKDNNDITAVQSLISNIAIDEFVVSVPVCQFKKHREFFLNATKEAGLSLQGIMLIDTNIIPSNPKKHMVLCYNHKNPQDIIPVRILSLVNSEMIIHPEEYTVTDKYLYSGVMTINDVLRINTPVKEKKKRNAPYEYWFSSEIRIQYRIRNKKGKNIAIVSYDSIPDSSGRSRKLSRNIEKGLRFTDEDDLKHRLSKTLLLDELYQIITRDIKQNYTGSYVSLTLKSLWYIKISALRTFNTYDETLWITLFETNSDVPKLTYTDFLSGHNISVLEDYLNGMDSQSKKSYLIQFSLLFDTLINDKEFRYNPFKGMLSDIDNRMSAEQYEVRNALVKKNLSISQQINLLQNTCHSESWEHSESFKTLIIFFRLFTAIPIREMVALNWNNLKYVDEYRFYQIQIVMRIDSDKKTVYGMKDDLKRLRLIPLVPILSRMLFVRKNRWMHKYNLTEEQMSDIPIFCESYDRRRKHQQIMKYDTINRICRDALSTLNIPRLEVRLPGDKELVTDLNRYYSDIFLSNFRYHANHTCLMNRGEINYLLGIEQEDTYAKHYCDFTNDAIQFQMQRKLIRWIVLLLSSNNDTDKINPGYVQCTEYRISPSKVETILIQIRSQYGATAKIITFKNKRKDEPTDDQ